MKSHAQLDGFGRWCCLPRKLEAIAETAKHLLPGGMRFRGVERPEAEPLLIRRPRTVEQLTFDEAGNLDRLFSAVDRSDDERDLIVSRLPIAIEAAGEQRVDLQAGHLKVPLTEIERFIVTGRLDELLLERLVQPASGREFRIVPIGLRVQRTELVLLVTQASFQQIDVAAMRTARNGNDEQELESEPHP